MVTKNLSFLLPPTTNKQNTKNNKTPKHLPRTVKSRLKQKKKSGHLTHTTPPTIMKAQRRVGFLGKPPIVCHEGGCNVS